MNDEELRILFVDIFKRLDKLEEELRDLEIRHRNLVMNLKAVDY
jgi:hypothetical protein